MHDIRYDAIHDEFLVVNPFAQAVLVFRGGANGEEAPVRVIQGPRTELAGTTVAGLDRLDVDPVHGEIVVPNGDSILVFPREANGDVAPLRIIQGPDTQLQATRAIAVDPIHNLIIIGDFGGSTGRDEGRGNLAIFGRTDNGNVKPRAVIKGPNTGLTSISQIQVSAAKGWIVVTHPSDQSEPEPEGIFVGIWSINDNGDVPPHWMIGGPKSQLKKPRGVALNPKDKELIVADMRLNAVLTYYFPEIF